MIGNKDANNKGDGRNVFDPAAAAATAAAVAADGEKTDSREKEEQPTTLLDEIRKEAIDGFGLAWF